MLHPMPPQCSFFMSRMPNNRHCIILITLTPENLGEFSEICNNEEYQRKKSLMYQIDTDSYHHETHFLFICSLRISRFTLNNVIANARKKWTRKSLQCT